MKILYYSDVVFPKPTTAMSRSAREAEILTIKHVAAYLKVTERTIYRLAAAKKIPAFKVGGVWRFSSIDIEGWIKQRSMEDIRSQNEDVSMSNSQPNEGEAE